MNLTIIAGVVHGAPVAHDLADGTIATSFDVVVKHAEREIVPVTYFGSLALDEGEGVVVIGRTRKRFWRDKSTSRARTDVVADAVIPTRQTKRARRAIEKALDEGATAAARRA